MAASFAKRKVISKREDFLAAFFSKGTISHTLLLIMIYLIKIVKNKKRATNVGDVVVELNTNHFVRLRGKLR